jgi:hypothetical protein
MTHPDLETDVAALLEEAATAHSVDEAESLSGSDDQWPAWYAAYLLAHGLRERLPQTSRTIPTVSPRDSPNSRPRFSATMRAGIGVASTPNAWWPASVSVH